ncbi:RagB/SusD family nutrient uptake outer membrane protein [Mucilaginibacter sp.]|uniref:RagB/SusD family nutrient uptake outer membrane protein n=1 Tax=Mucilaginibacter sp. TaxID=1882438 RepID=UPI003263FE3F
MKNYKILSTWLLTAVLLGTASCKKELDVKNPNSPTLEQALTETGITSLASGGVYLSGFNGSNPSVLNGLNALGDSYFSQGIQYHELLGDNIGAEASNININVVNLPDYAVFDDNSKTTNSSPQKSVLRISNTRDKRPSNVFFLEWTYMYGLNNACNQVLSLVDGISFSGDATAKKNTIKAWCYWWKGFAYSKLGSLYYAGLISDKVNGISSNYVNSAALIAESNKNLDASTALLTGMANVADYTVVMSKLIPSFVQTGNGNVPTPAMFVHSINTLKARNIVANKKAADMTAADWTAVLTLVNGGIASSDNVFAGRTSVSNGFFSATGGSVAALTTGPPKSSTFKISERFIQSYQAGDKRLSNNFTAITPYLNQVGGFTFSTRWQLVDGGNDMAGVQVLSDRTPGNYQLYIGPSYEENELMKAEALISTGGIPAALQSIDNVRAAQGAGLAPLAGTGLNALQATAQLRSERRVALVFRGLAFYDARRYGIIYDIAKGGGVTNAVVVGSTGTVNTHATINYNFLDYWDVPADESVLNPPATGSAPIVNPN